MTLERWQKIEQAYHAALEREPGQREGFLAETCQGDDDLRREVESLLAQETQAEQFLESPVLHAAAKALAEHQSRSLIGQQLGTYKIVSLVGAGGMGEVYQAHDTKLGREVAIKVLPSVFTNDPERLSRFQREARLLASLNHPNIATIHGLEHSEGVDYLVMELVPGETLAERISKGAMSLQEALNIAGEIAEGLEAAHEKGVIHRDLKPTNVKVTPEGRVKVLDFGLAKAFAGDGATDVSQGPTLSEEGRILGTAAYMSPEQARGKQVDKRTDIWAFGCVVYEMLTAKQAFRGETQSDTIAAVLEREPDWQALPHTIPAKIRDLLRRSLQRELHRRLRDICDARLELGEALTEVSATNPALLIGRRAAPFRWVLAIVTVAVATLIGISIGIHVRPSELDRLVQFNLAAQGQTEKLNALPIPSPDGSALVYSATDTKGVQTLWLRSLDAEVAKSLAGTEDALAPFWSPDGRWIAFYSQGKLKKVSRDGASVQTIAALGGFINGAWSSTGEILFAPGNREPIYAIRDSGGTPKQITKLDASRTENSHRWITFLPDGRRFLFLARCNIRENNALYEGSLDSGEVRRVAHMDSNVAYVPPRQGRTSMLLLAKDGKLFEQPFDGSKLMGEPTSLTEVQYNAISIMGDFALSVDGRVLVTRPATETAAHLTWFDRTGMPIGTLGAPGAYQQPRLSPAGDRVIFNRPDDNGGNRDIWQIEMSRGIASRLTVNPANEWDELWAPDGHRIIFASDRSGNRFGSMFEKSSMDPGTAETAVPGLPDFANPEDWSADGRWIAFSNGQTHGTIWIAPTFGERKPFLFLKTQFEERGPNFSPDAKWIAYSSNESGHFEVYARPFSGVPATSEGKIQISERGGYFATWSRDGKELFFVGPDSKFNVATVTGLGSAGVVPSPRALFEVCPGNTPTGEATEGREFDVGPDGQKFLFVCGSDSQRHYSVFANWQPK